MRISRQQASLELPPLRPRQPTRANLLTRNTFQNLSPNSHAPTQCLRAHPLRNQSQVAFRVSHAPRVTSRQQPPSDKHLQICAQKVQKFYLREAWSTIIKFHRRPPCKSSSSSNSSITSSIQLIQRRSLQLYNSSSRCLLLRGAEERLLRRSLTSRRMEAVEIKIYSAQSWPC